MYLFHRLDVEEICPSLPKHTSSLAKIERLSSHKQSGLWTYDSHDQKGQPLVPSPQDDECFIRRQPENKASIAESTQRSRTNRIRRGMMSGPISSKPQVKVLHCKKHTDSIFIILLIPIIIDSIADVIAFRNPTTKDRLGA